MYMKKVLEKWNNKWKTFRLQFLMSGLDKNICDFFEQLTIQNIDSCDYQQDGFYITMQIHCKNEITNEHFKILYADLGDGFLVQRKIDGNEETLDWTKLFTENNVSDMDLEKKIDTILFSFDFEKMLQEVGEAEDFSLEKLKDTLLQNTTIPEYIKQTKSFQTFLKTGELRLNEEEFLCLFWNEGELEADDGYDEVENEEYPAVYARYENEECYDEKITKWKTDPKIRLIYLTNDYGNPNQLIEKSIVGFIKYAETYDKEGE